MANSPQTDPRLDARVYEVAAELAYPRAVQDRHEEQARILLMRADAADEASGVRRVTAQELADQLEFARTEERQATYERLLDAAQGAMNEERRLQLVQFIVNNFATIAADSPVGGVS